MIFNSPQTLCFVAVLAMNSASTPAQASDVSYKYETVEGLKVFYREAGPKTAKTIVLLHGFPSSSHMFRDLIPKLSDKFHVVAPDYIGFGYSDTPSRSAFSYTFDNLSRITDEFLEQTGNRSYTLYLQDYGGPVGFRIAVAHPERIEGLVIQNANAYSEGISKMAFGVLAEFGKNRNPESEKVVRGQFDFEGIKFGYLEGSPNSSAISPDSYTFDNAMFRSRPNNDDIQLDLFADYTHNIALYSKWQAYFRERQPRTLVVWGKGDPFFTVEGARAYSRDLKHAELTILDAGHFALEEKLDDIAFEIQRFLEGN